MGVASSLPTGHVCTSRERGFTCAISNDSCHATVGGGAKIAVCMKGSDPQIASLVRCEEQDSSVGVVSSLPAKPMPIIWTQHLRNYIPTIARVKWIETHALAVTVGLCAKEAQIPRLHLKSDVRNRIPLQGWYHLCRLCPCPSSGHNTCETSSLLMPDMD